MSRRTDKIAKLIHQHLAELINYRLSDPRISRPVNITAVEVSPDLRRALVKVTASGATESQMRTLMRGLEAAAGRLGRMLGDRLATRTVPRLDIRPDTQAIRAGETLEAIRRAMADTPPAPEAPDAEPPEENEPE